MRLGTASYMSPEQAKGDPLDHRTDIWAFGVVLYELLSGRRPFEGTHDLAVIYSVVNDDPEPLRDISTTVPAALENIVIKALSKDPDDRYDSIDDVLADLEGVVPEDDSEVTRSIPTAEITAFSPIKPEKKSKLPFAAAAAVAVGLAAAPGYFLTTDSASVDTASAPPELTLPDEGAASAAPGALSAAFPDRGASPRLGRRRPNRRGRSNAHPLPNRRRFLVRPPRGPSPRLRWRPLLPPPCRRRGSSRRPARRRKPATKRRNRFRKLELAGRRLNRQWPNPPTDGSKS